MVCVPFIINQTPAAGGPFVTAPSGLRSHPNHEGTVFSVFMLRTDRTSGH
jgi:hypothetical protein